MFQWLNGKQNLLKGERMLYRGITHSGVGIKGSDSCNITFIEAGRVIEAE